MKMTIGEARRTFEGIEQRVNDPIARRLRDVLKEAEEKARSFTDSYLAQREAEALTVRDTALRELTAVRDEADEISRTAPEGRMSSDQIASQLTELRRRQTQAEYQLDRADQIAEHIATVEADPVTWYDAQSKTQKHLQNDWPW